MASPAASLLSSPTIRMVAPMSSTPCCTYKMPASMSSSTISAVSAQVLENRQKKNARWIVMNVSTVETPVVEETKECSLPTWAEFDLGRAPIFWKTTNGLPPTSGEMLTIFYNPAASKLIANDDFGIAFNGGFNQSIMCGGEPRSMTRKNRGKADLPFYVIKVRIPKHAVCFIFSFTNGTDWDGPYKLQFQVLKEWKNKPMTFFNEGLAKELSKEGACEEAIFPDSHVVVTRCAIGNLSAEGADRCNLDLVSGCTDPCSPNFNPLADVDDGSCTLDLESEEEA